MNKLIAIKIISFLTILLFVYTGIAKLIDFSIFKEQIAMSPLLNPVAQLIAWILPLTELATAILIFVPKLRLYGFFIGTALMILFTIYLVMIQVVDEQYPCSCGGLLELLSWKTHLVLNCMIILLEIVGIRLQLNIQSQQKLALQKY